MNKKTLIVLIIVLLGLIICCTFLHINKINDNKYILAYVPYKYVEVNSDEIILKKGEEFSFVHNIDINEIADNIELKIDNEEIIKSNDNLGIKAIDVGQANLSIINNKGRLLKEVKVTVKEVPTGIEINKTNLIMKKGETKSIKVKVLPDNLENKEVSYRTSDENIATVDENGNIKGISSGKVVISVETKETPTITKKVNVRVINIEVKNNGATYVDDILIVNKKYRLPSTYNQGVDKTAKEKFEEMRKVALKDNISLRIVSSYRSYSSQAAIYNKNLNLHGAYVANRFSAKPGESEHQSGLAFDINQANRSFVGTKEAQWLQENCYKFGFIIRYPRGKEGITGYVYEPWHIRYVGEKVSKEIFESGLCLEEYLGIS